MNGQIDKYYTSRKLELLDRLDEDARYWGQVMARNYDDDLANIVLRGTHEEFEHLIPQIPYIGGDENHLTGSLIRSVRCLAFYKAMRGHGKTVEEAGKVLYDATVAQCSSPRPPIPASEWLSPEALMKRRRDRAKRSQECRFPGDWVYEFVEGDGVEFDYGYNFIECGTQKFYHAQDADEFLPFYCFLDFPVSKASSLGLVRTMTLAEGCKKCDFRFKKGREVEQEWPPQFLERGSHRHTRKKRDI